MDMKNFAILDPLPEKDHENLELFCDNHKIFIHNYIKYNDEPITENGYVEKPQVIRIGFTISAIEMIKFSYDFMMKRLLVPNYHFLKKRTKTRAKFKKQLYHFIILNRQYYGVNFSFSDLNKVKLFKHNENPFDSLKNKNFTVNGIKITRFNFEIRHSVENEQDIDFIKSEDDEIMINATQMAKIFGKRIDHFLKSDHANAFIKALEFTPFGGNSEPLKKDEIIQTKGQSGTWMHRILALKFAAWLDPYFEVWVFSTIDQILLGHYREMREATIEKIKVEKELALRKEDLLKKNPELAEIFELELKITAADKRRFKAMKASIAQLRFDLYPEDNIKKN